MNERMMMVAAIAWFCDGYTNVQIGEALGVDPKRAQELIEAGAEAQGRGEIGYMKVTRGPDGKPVVRDDG